MSLRFLVVASTTLLLSACAHDSPSSAANPTNVEVLIGAAPVLIASVDAPGFNVEDLTARLRDAFARTSGVPVVDPFSVQAEIGACETAPCSTTQQDRFKAATTIVGTTVSKVGASVIGAVRIQQGLREVVRINATGDDVAAVVEDLGRRAGAALREALLRPVPTDATPATNER